MMDEDESFVLYIGRDDCFDCNEFKPHLDEFLSDNPGMYIYYLDIKEFYHSDDKHYYEEIKQLLEYDWTPSLRFVYEGEIESKYQYLDNNFYDIEDSKERIKTQNEFIESFKDWMNNVYN